MTNAMQKTKGTHGYGLENVASITSSNNTMRRLFDRDLWDMESTGTRGSGSGECEETENQYEVDVIAPGCRKEDFRIQVQANELNISFNHNEQKKEENEKAGWVRNEYIQRSFSRSFTLDETVETAGITASYNDGILHVILPKNEKAKPVSMTVEVK